VQLLLEALKHDNLVALKKRLESGEVDLTQEVIIGAEYEMDEPDEVPLLSFAISSGASLEAIEMLLDTGIDISEVNREGVGALDIAIKHKRMDIVELCERQGVDLCKSRRKSGITPLILAASFSDMEMVTYLLSKGASIEETDNYGMTAAAYAKRLGQKKMLEFLESQESV